MGRIAFPQLSNYDALLRRSWNIIEPYPPQQKLIDKVIPAQQLQHKTQGAIIHQLMMAINNSDQI